MKNTTEVATVLEDGDLQGKPTIIAIIQAMPEKVGF